jgi:osmotically-inducible protein OsmY
MEMKKLAFLGVIAAAVWYWTTGRKQPQTAGSTWPSAQPEDSWPRSEPAQPAPDAEQLKAETKLHPDDQTLVDRVESEIFRDRHEVKGKVNINAEEGVVVLRGELDSQDMIDDLVNAARDVDGVRNVENLLHLPGTEAPMHDS